MIVLIALFWRLLVFRSPDPVGYDESVYCAYARTFGESGLDGLRSVVQAWPTDATLSKGPLPFRLFFIVPGAWLCRLLGGYTVANMALLSSLFGLGFIVVTLLLARRWFGPVYGFLAALLMIFSPLGTGLSNRGLQDTCFAFVVTTCVWLYDRCWRERRRWDPWLLGIALVAGFLTKESMAFVYPSFALAGIFYARAESGTGWRSKIPIAVPFAIAPLVHLAIVSWVSGGLSTAIETYRAYSAMQGRIPYAIQFQGGSWYRYPVDLILLSPLVTLVAIVGASSPFGRADIAAGRSLSLIYLLSGLSVFSILPLLNVRIVLFLEPYIRMFAVVGAVAVGDRLLAGSRFRLSLATVLLLALVWTEAVQFHSIFDVGGVYDPITLNLIHAAGFVR